MQINTNNNLLSSLSAGYSKPVQADKNEHAGDAGRAVELGKAFGDVIDKAMVEPDYHAAVEQARQALADGTLDTQDAVFAAAERLMRLGI